MSTITFNRDASPVTAKLLTNSTDASLLIVSGEHSDASPSTLEMRRKLPVNGSTVRRAYITRRVGKTINTGTENETVVPLIAKLELSIPVGVPDSDVIDVIHDIVGVTATSEFAELRQYGIVDL